MSSTQIDYIIFILIVILAGLMLFLLLRSRQNKRGERIIKEKKKGRNYLYSLYRFYASFPLTKKYYNRVRNRISAIYPADEISLNIRTTKTFTRTLLLGIAMVIATFIFAQWDWFFICAGLMVSYVITISLIDLQLKTLEQRILKQFSSFIDSVREQYNECGRVDDAVGNVLERLPYEVGLHAAMLHKVLTSTRVEEAAEKYVEMAPNRFFMTFAATSSSTVEYGDKLLENGGSLFLKNLNFLKEEINIELLKISKNAAVFQGLKVVSLLPIFCVKPIEIWATNQVSEMAQYYKGSYGILSMIGIFIISAIAYTTIDNLENAKKAEIKEDSLLKTIANKEPIKTVIAAQVNRNYSKSLRTDEMLRFTGDRLGISTFILKRYITAIAVAALTLIVVGTSIVKDRVETISNFAAAYDTSFVPNEEYREIMRKTSKDYAAILKNEDAKLLNSQEGQLALTRRIKEETDVTQDDMAVLVAKEVAKRVGSYQEIYFKWWLLFFVFAAGMIGYYVPYFLLVVRQRAVRMNMEDEVAQFQTIALILMHVDGMNIKTLLEWLERFAYCFRTAISECIIGLPRGENKSIAKMRDSETFQPFQSFCNRLINVDSVGLERAFSSIETEREYYKEKRKEDNDQMIKKKANRARWAAIIPLVIVFALYLIYPMLKMAMSMMSEFSNVMK